MIVYIATEGRHGQFRVFNNLEKAKQWLEKKLWPAGTHLESYHEGVVYGPLKWYKPNKNQVCLGSSVKRPGRRKYMASEGDIEICKVH